MSFLYHQYKLNCGVIFLTSACCAQSAADLRIVDPSTSDLTWTVRDPNDDWWSTPSGFPEDAFLLGRMESVSHAKNKRNWGSPAVHKPWVLPLTVVDSSASFCYSDSKSNSLLVRALFPRYRKSRSLLVNSPFCSVNAHLCRLDPPSLLFQTFNLRFCTCNPNVCFFNPHVSEVFNICWITVTPQAAEAALLRVCF